MSREPHEHAEATSSDAPRTGKGAPPRYIQLADRIATKIRTEDQNLERLPGLRQLAEEFDVSIVTISRAVQVLRERGLIGRVDRSGCYIARGETHSGTWGVAMRVTPGEWQKLSGSMTWVGFEQAMKTTPNLRFLQFPQLEEKPNSSELRASLLESQREGMKGLFLLPARFSEEWRKLDEAFLDLCDTLRIPVVLIERNLRGSFEVLKRDMACIDDFEGGMLCARALIETGRKRIGVVIASPTSSHEQRLAGATHAIRFAAMSGQYPELEPNPTLYVTPTDRNRKEVDRWLADQIVKDKLDGVFCYQDSVAVGLAMELLRRGVSIPKQVGLVGYDDLPIGDFFTLGLTTYRYPSLELVRAALWLMQRRISQPSAAPLRVSVPGTLVVRESTEMSK
jgi:LacI family transcriptional regulator